MSRRVQKPVHVEVNQAGVPISVEGFPILDCPTHYREWVGVLEGEPQIDVWKVRTKRGVWELHFLSYPTGDEDIGPGSWLLARRED